MSENRNNNGQESNLAQPVARKGQTAHARDQHSA